MLSNPIISDQQVEHNREGQHQYKADVDDQFSVQGLQSSLSIEQLSQRNLPMRIEL